MSQLALKGVAAQWKGLKNLRLPRGRPSHTVGDPAAAHDAVSDADRAETGAPPPATSMWHLSGAARESLFE